MLRKLIAHLLLKLLDRLPVPRHAIQFGPASESASKRCAGYKIVALFKSDIDADLTVPLDPAGGNDLHLVRQAVEWSVARIREHRPVYLCCRSGLSVAPAIAAAVMGRVGIAPSTEGAMKRILISNGIIRSDCPAVFDDVLRMEKQKVVYMNCDAHGFGDATFCAWIAEGSRNAPITLVNRATGPMKAYLEMLGEYVAERPPDECVTTFDAYFTWECELERGSVPRVLSRGRALGITCSAPKRPKVTVPGKATTWAQEIAIAERKTGRKKLVVIWPNTVWSSREWPAAYWVDLAWKLKALGYGVVFCLGTDDERFSDVPNRQFGMPWENWAAMMLAADLNVCISSGPACLAGTLDVPTLVLEGPTKPTIWAHCPSIEVMRVTTAEIGCVGCHFGQPYRAACNVNCQALMRLYPERVLQRIEAKLKELDDDPDFGKYGGRAPVSVFDPDKHFTAPAGPESHPRSVGRGLLSRVGAAESAG